LVCLHPQTSPLFPYTTLFRSQGHSLRALMQPKKSTEPGASDIYGESFLPRIHFNWSELRGIEIGGYHFIDAPQPELYDLRKDPRSEEHTSELQSPDHLVCRLL